MPKPPPIILGHQVAAVVTEIGDGVADYRIGDRVVASETMDYCSGRSVDGGYATHCALRTTSLLGLPDAVSFVQGAAATDAGQTSPSALVTAGELKAGRLVAELN
jgi:NADPH:quinone reductase-like Zn-dependent oxidoreductase